MFLGACSNDKIIKERLKVLYSSPVIFTNSDLLLIDNSVNMNRQGETSKARYKLLVYNSPGECSMCDMGKMSEWNALLNLEKEGKLNLFFIFSPSIEEKEDLISAYRSSGLEHSVLIDTCGIFSEQNPHIPMERNYHTLLLDSVGNVVLVGNPLRNKKIMGMLNKIVSAK